MIQNKKDAIAALNSAIDVLAKFYKTKLNAPFTVTKTQKWMQIRRMKKSQIIGELFYISNRDELPILKTEEFKCTNFS